MARFPAPPPRPFLKWAGGKGQLLAELNRAVAAAGPFKRYHEPFLGGGALFFDLARRGGLPHGASLADINENLVKTYSGVRDDVDGVIRALDNHKRRNSREYYYEMRQRRPRTPATHAARVIYLNKTCFNGLYRENSRGEFNVPFGEIVNPGIYDEENLRMVAEVLQEVDLEATGFDTVVERAARGDLVYFDPPYNPLSKTSFTKYAKGDFGLDSQEALADVARRLTRRGVRVLLSNSMTEVTRSLYPDFHLREVHAIRSVNRRGDGRGRIPEALIANFPI